MMLTSAISSRLKGDRYIWMIVALLSLLSMLLIYSSTETLAYKKRGGDTEFYLIKQLVIMGGGLVLMYVFHLINYMKFAKLAMAGMAISVVLLLYTLVSGANINAAKRWIELPVVNLSFQTSDFAKMSLVMYLAWMLSQVQDKKLVGVQANNSFWLIFGPVLGICGLIAPANLSTALILFMTCVILMFIGRLEMRNMGYLFLLGLAVFAALVLLADAFPGAIRLDTWINRLRSFVTSEDPEVRFQVEQAKIAIAKGGLFGVGPGNGTQSNFLPHAYSDFIYCVILEEYGLVGGLTVIGLYLGMLIRCIRMVTLSGKAFGSLLALGLCVMHVLQAFANMAVAVNLLPVTGLTLPLVSLGGTSVIFSCISIGIILSVTKYMDDEAKAMNRPSMM